jgi:transcriptional regulator with XRE-family HTH domain
LEGIMTIYEKIKQLCENEGFAISSISDKIPGLNINKSSTTGWKNGAKPRADKIKIISDYFGVPISYFSEEAIKTEIPLPTDGLTDEERKLLEKFRCLSDERKAIAIQLLDPLAENR